MNPVIEEYVETIMIFHTFSGILLVLFSLYLTYKFIKCLVSPFSKDQEQLDGNKETRLEVYNKYLEMENERCNTKLIAAEKEIAQLKMEVNNVMQGSYKVDIEIEHIKNINKTLKTEIKELKHEKQQKDALIQNLYDQIDTFESMVEKQTFDPNFANDLIELIFVNYKDFIDHYTKDYFHNASNKEVIDNMKDYVKEFVEGEYVSLNKNYVFLCYIITMYGRYERLSDEYETFKDYLLSLSISKEMKDFIEMDTKDYLIEKFMFNYYGYLKEF